MNTNKPTPDAVFLVSTCGVYAKSRPKDMFRWHTDYFQAVDELAELYELYEHSNDPDERLPEPTLFIFYLRAHDQDYWPPHIGKGCFVVSRDTDAALRAMNCDVGDNDSIPLSTAEYDAAPEFIARTRRNVYAGKPHDVLLDEHGGIIGYVMPD